MCCIDRYKGCSDEYISTVVDDGVVWFAQPQTPGLVIHKSGDRSGLLEQIRKSAQDMAT
jgi:hypothetical protein